jgi:hypothetical protein
MSLAKLAYQLKEISDEQPANDFARFRFVCGHVVVCVWRSGAGASDMGVRNWERYQPLQSHGAV